MALLKASLPFSQNGDGSEYGIGFALFQTYSDGKRKPIGFGLVHSCVSRKTTLRSNARVSQWFGRWIPYPRTWCTRISLCTQTMPRWICFSPLSTPVADAFDGAFVSPKFTSKSNTRRVSQTNKQMSYNALPPWAKQLLMMIATTFPCYESVNIEL